LSHLNLEIKAYADELSPLREILTSQKAVAKGQIIQVDTYFNCSAGRLKLRENPDAAILIHYNRESIEGIKQSLVTMVTIPNPAEIKDILRKSLGIKVVVSKKREIYWIENVKFHLDEVDRLGMFVEIEAIDYEGTIGKEKLYAQCEYYLKLLQIPAQNLIKDSYSDLLLRLKTA